jgi:uncharacterized membrane protein YecN with MAPEG domain
MPVPVTALYAALLGLVTVALQLLVGRLRLDTDVSLHDGGHEALAVAIRRHANFAEHVPFALILLALIELNGAPAGWLHTLGGALLLARIVHPFGLRWDVARVPARFVGAFTTLVVTLAAIATALYQVLTG